MDTSRATNDRDEALLDAARGDDVWGHLVRWHNDMLASLVSEHGGDLVRWTGDGSFVTFADAGQALDCGYGFSGSPVVPLKGLSEPLEVLAVEWR
jgi:hypothetical protein